MAINLVSFIRYHLTTKAKLTILGGILLVTLTAIVIPIVIIQCSIPASPTIPAPTAPTKESTTTEPAKIQANESTVNGNVPHFPTYAATTIYPITNQTTEIVITTEATEVATTTETTTDELVTTEGTDKLNITSTDGSTPQAMSVPGNEETFSVDSASTTFTDEKYEPAEDDTATESDSNIAH